MNFLWYKLATLNVQQHFDKNLHLPRHWWWWLCVEWYPPIFVIARAWGRKFHKLMTWWQKIENFNIAQNRSKSVGYDILKYSTSFGKDLEQEDKFKDNFGNLKKFYRTLKPMRNFWKPSLKLSSHILCHHVINLWNFRPIT